MMTVRQLLPIEEFIRAIIHAAILLPLLAIIGHPVEEWAITAAVLYVFLWLSREVIAGLSLYVSKSLLRYGERVSQKLNVAILDNQPSEYNLPAKVIASVILVLLFCAISGAGLGTGSLAVNGAGLTPLPGYIAVIAGGLFLAGTIGVSLILGLLALVLVAVDNLSESVNPRFNQFDAITRQVDTRLRNKALTRQSPATS